MTGRTWALVLALVALVCLAFGCRRPETIRTVTVKVPVPVPCPVPPRLARPRPPAELLDPTASKDVKAKAIQAWVLLVQAYAEALEIQIEAFRAPSQETPIDAR